MNSTLQHWIESHLWPWLGDIAWQGTALLAATLLAVQLLHGRSAAVRHAVLVIGVLGVALLAILSCVLPTWSLRMSPALTLPPQPELRQSRPGGSHSSEAQAAPAVPLSHANTDRAASTRLEPASTPLLGAPSRDPRLSTPVIVATLWSAGIATGGLLLIGSLFMLRRLRLRAGPARHPALLAALHRACRDAGLRPDSVQLFLADRGVMPTMWGWRRITVLLPRDAKDWTEERLDFVLRHELAHSVRGDVALSLGCWIALLPFWWHPLAWFSLRWLSRLREEACDEQVLSGLRRPQHADYAETLVQVIAAASPASSRPWLPALAMASAHARTLRSRLEAIVDEHRDRRPIARRGKACALFVMAVLATGLSMLGACRESSQPAIGTTSQDGSRTYFLSDRQWMALTQPPKGDRPAPEPQPADPFKPRTEPPKPVSPAPVDLESLPKLALRIRTHLLAEGVEFTRAPDGEVVVLKDERTMRVWADEANHTKLTEVLRRAGQKTMVRIVCHAFAVPLDSKWITSLTTLDASRPVGSKDQVPSMSAVLSEAEAVSLIAKIRADKACTLFAAPTITTADGQRATMEVIREFIYPTEFDPPRVPESTTAKPGDPLLPTAFPVTPTTPTAFEMRPVGLRCELDPTVEPGGRINLALNPEWVVFEGFVNYGTPIYASATDAFGKVVPVELTANKINQPLFRTASVYTSVTLRSGDHVVIGGFGEAPGADLANPPGNIAPHGLIPGKDVVRANPAAGTQGNENGDLSLKNLPPMSKVDRAIFFLFQAKIVE